MEHFPAPFQAIFAAWSTLVGLVIGSFLNVVIARVPAGQSIVRPRSRCPSCGALIHWYDNVPVLSWLLLRARCRGCGAHISARYPLVELLGGGAGLLAFQRHGLTLAALCELTLAALLLSSAFIDLDTWLLPNALTWPLIGAGLLASAFALTPAGGLRPALYGAGLGFIAFAAVSVLGERIFEREALGFGDVWLLAGLGAWFGHLALLPIVMFASVQGTVVGLLLIALGKGEPGPTLPTGAPDAGESPPASLAVPEEPSGASGPRPIGEAALEEEEDWVPPRHAVPFGPFLAAAALEWLYLGDALCEFAPFLRVFR